MSKTAKTGTKGPAIRKTRAVKGPRIATRRGRVEVAGTPPAGTYVDPLVLKEHEAKDMEDVMSDLDNGPESVDDPEDVYEGVDDQAMQGPFGNTGGRL